MISSTLIHLPATQARSIAQRFTVMIAHPPPANKQIDRSECSMDRSRLLSEPLETANVRHDRGYCQVLLVLALCSMEATHVGHVNQ